jgi:hypothetical protein
MMRKVVLYCIVLRCVVSCIKMLKMIVVVA